MVLIYDSSHHGVIHGFHSFSRLLLTSLHMSYTSFKYPNRLSNHLEKSAYPLRKLKPLFKYYLTLNEVAKPIIKTHTSIEANVLRYTNGVLSLTVADHSTANHLRYLSSIVLNELSTTHHFQDIVSLSILVTEDAANTMKKNHVTQIRQHSIAHKRNEMSDETQEMLVNLANQHIKHDNLKHALLVLAKQKK